MANLDMAVLILDPSANPQALINKCLRHRCHTAYIPISHAELRSAVENAGLKCAHYDDSTTKPMLPLIKGNTAILVLKENMLTDLELEAKQNGIESIRK